MAERDEVVVLAEEPAAAVPAAADAVTIDEAAGGVTLPAHAELLPDGSVRLPLLIPVAVKFRSARTEEVTEERTEALHLHRLNGAALRAIQAAAPGAMAAVALAQSARLSEVKFNAIYDRMDGADIQFAAQVLTYFLTPGRPTGR